MFFLPPLTDKNFLWEMDFEMLQQRGVVEICELCLSLVLPRTLHPEPNDETTLLPSKGSEGVKSAFSIDLLTACLLVGKWDYCRNSSVLKE